MSTAGPGAGAPRNHNTRYQRHTAVLARWPVLEERWARQVERKRRQAAGEAPDPFDREGISLLEAINRATGLPPSHGADAVARRDAAGRG